MFLEDFEAVFHAVCHMADHLKAQHIRSPFDGVRRPKQFVHLFGIITGRLKIEQRTFNRFHVLSCFFNEVSDNLLLLGIHGSTPQLLLIFSSKHTHQSIPGGDLP